jgi:DNA-binding MarR family transcriptional regulator
MTQPATSRDSYHAHLDSGKLTENQQIVLDTLTRLGEANAYEIAKNCHLDAVEVNRRLPELRKAGRVERTMNRHNTAPPAPGKPQNTG